jgi:hypothetical protein
MANPRHVTDEAFQAASGLPGPAAHLTKLCLEHPVHPAAALMKEAVCPGCGKYGHELVCGECYIHVLDVTVSYELQRVMAGEEGAIEALEEVTVLERELRARRSRITGAAA